MNRLPLFPITATIEQDTLTLAGHSLAALADEFGTPLYASMAAPRWTRRPVQQLQRGIC